MNFAYVRFVDDGIKKVVETKKIKKFNENNLNYKKTYKVLFDDDQYYRAHIICVGESEEEVITVGESKRFRVPTSRFINLEESDRTEVEDNDGGLTLGTTIISTKKRGIKKDHVQQRYSDKRLINDINNIHSINDPRDKFIEDLQKEIKNLQVCNEELLHENKEIRTLNIELQNKILAAWEDIKSTTIAKICASNVEGESTMTSIGHRIDGKVHLGQNVWLPEQIYNSVDIHSKTDAAFVRSLACTVFGTTVLASSSVTGQQSNRTKKVPGPALDATKLLAIHDIVKFRLTNKGESLEKVLIFCNKIDSIIASKIADLKRGPKLAKKKYGTETDVPESSGNLNLLTEVCLAQAILDTN